MKYADLQHITSILHVLSVHSMQRPHRNNHHLNIETRQPYKV